MFILYGLLAGVIAGLVMGGRPGGLADLRLRWVPFFNVFSVGDILIAAGVAMVIALAMRRSRGGVPLGS